MAARLVTESGQAATVTAARAWAKRIREDLRDAETLMARGDFNAAAMMFQDASCAATEAETIAQTISEAKR